MAELILIRGLPGSGKSTLAKSMCPVVSTWRHVEADQYFIDPLDGSYEFIPQKVPTAHQYCQNKTKHLLLAAGYNVVVSNTFTQLWEMEPYFSMGADKVTIITCEGAYGNVHGVPADKVAQMRARWEPVTAKWLESMKGMKGM